MRRLVVVVCSAIALVCTGCWSQKAKADFITVASTTSTQNSGLFDHILPQFTAKTGIEVRIVAVGTGQALRLARNGDADVLLVHHRPSEEAFVAAGFGVERFDVMYNDFLVVGPASDPAAVNNQADVVLAFQRIANTESIFVSRGDDSGTHKKEREIWQVSGVHVTGLSGTWYRELGSGMGATLNAAAGMNAYTLTDRGTWLSFLNRQGLTIVSEGDERLFNPYGVVLVNADRHPHVKSQQGQAFIDWLISAEGQNAITSHTIGGQQLFFSNSSREAGG